MMLIANKHATKCSPSSEEAPSKVLGLSKRRLHPSKDSMTHQEHVASITPQT